MDPATYAARRLKVYEAMRQNGIAAVMFEDTEGRRSQLIRYLSGHPGDALLFLIAGDEGRAVLVPWDANLAARLAAVDETVPYSEFGRDAVKTAAGILLPRLDAGVTIELPSSLPYPRFADFAEALGELRPACRNDGIENVVNDLRSVKDAAEIAALRRSCEITNRVTDMLEAGFRRGEFAAECDVAMLIEREARRGGGEGPGFETIVAGPERSFGIHAFPPFGDGPVGGAGFTIIDFGIKVDGYTSDVTLTVAAGPLGTEREEMLTLVEKAYETAIAIIAPGAETRAASIAVDALFAAAGRSMPHGLGHGFGLEAHELPYQRSRDTEGKPFRPGMVVTVEPGLYHPVLGGVRLENDLFIREDGVELLTSSRIIRL